MLDRPVSYLPMQLITANNRMAETTWNEPNLQRPRTQN